MSAKTWAVALGLAFSVSAPLAHAADHKDGPAVTADPATDITDVYAWMQADSSRVFLVMNVFPAATTAARFSDSALYIFHTNNRTNGADSYGAEVNIICQFDKGTPQQAECWAGKDEYVKGNAGLQSTDSAGKPVWNGISSRSGKLRVFTGLRNDPFFFNLAGFNDVTNRIKGAYAGLAKDNAGCPTIPATTRTALVAALAQNGMTPAGAGTDSFAKQNVLSIVVSVDRNILSSNGQRPLLSVWGSTNKKLN
jgi:hypothetical protein